MKYTICILLRPAFFAQHVFVRSLMSVLYMSSMLPSIPFPLVFPTADGHLGFSQSPVTVANTVMNILALAFWWACAPFLLD